MSHWRDYIIVQAGGQGSRLKHLTANRPKCMVPVENKPMLFHLFEQFPSSKFLIIGDTHFEVLEAYLANFCQTDYRLICSTGQKGTLSGIAAATAAVPANQAFMIVWSDLILPENVIFPECPGNYIGLGTGIPCRWKFEDGQITEQASMSHGIAGLFLLENNSALGRIPESGQLVKFMSRTPEKFKPWPVMGIREFGLLETYEMLEKPKCRFFNEIEFGESQIVKRPLTSQGRELADKERNWYKSIAGKNFPIPEILDFDPLVMERIEGASLAEVDILSLEKKEAILLKIMAALSRFHSFASRPASKEDVRENYISKTWARLEKVRTLLPFSQQKFIRINGKQCRNPFHLRAEAAKLAEAYMPAAFSFIHGDCTFSNIILTKDQDIIFIDPRGYFGKTDLLGDKAYDFAKLYYSLFGNYDAFNQKRFRLRLTDDEVTLLIESNGWENLISTFWRLLPADVQPAQVRLVHALIWLSLTTYALEDYDAICGAFYNGALLLEECLDEHHI